MMHLKESTTLCGQEVKSRSEAEKQQGSDGLGQHYCYKMGQEAEEQQGSASKKEGGIETSH